ncbi:hypothetical protein GG344DRAFT_60973 [Lentinula edodes]|nr:hypothetical protein GG344DRAFT_60973 [Lentinula edodes]
MALVQSLSSVAIPDWVQVSRSHFHRTTSTYLIHNCHDTACKPMQAQLPSSVNSYASRTAMSIYTSFSKSAHSPRHIKFGRYCIPKISLREQSIGNPTLVFIYGELLVQLVIHGLAWKRTIWDLRQYYSYPPPALLSVLNRDSLKVFMGISVAMAAVGVATLKIFFPVTFIFPLFISLVSALVQGCRTILNLQRLDALTEPGTSEPHKEPELTTIDNSSMTNWDAAWDSSTFHMEDSHPHRDTR